MGRQYFPSNPAFSHHKNETILALTVAFHLFKRICVFPLRIVVDHSLLNASVLSSM